MPNTIHDKINEQSIKERRSTSVIKPYIYFILEIAFIVELSYILSELQVYVWLIVVIAITYLIVKVLRLLEILQRTHTVKAHDKYRIL
jgi:hypothetical protein